LWGDAALAPDAELDRLPLYASPTRSPESVVYGDFTPIVLDYPRDLAFASGLRAGRIDLWNPLSACGAPLWAEQGGPFFPLKLVFYLWPSRSGYDLFLLLRLVVAALGALALARARGLPPVYAFAAGLLFELSGVMVAQLPFGSASALCLAPWIVLAARKLVVRGSRRTLAGAALILGVTGSSGHPTLALLVLSGFGVAVAAYAIRAWRVPRQIVTQGARILAVVGLGGLLMAPTVLPTVELVLHGKSYKRSSQGEHIWYQNLTRSRLALPLSLFAPGSFDSVRRQQPRLMLHPWGLSAALSPVTLVLAGTGLLLGALDIGLVALLLFGIGLGLSPPGLGWLHEVPGLALILPIYAWIWVMLPLTQAAASGASALSTPTGRRRALPVLAVVFSGSLAVLLVDHPVWLQTLGNPLRRAIFEQAQWRELLFGAALATACVGAAFLKRAGRFVGPTAVALGALQALLILRPLAIHNPSELLRRAPPVGVRLLQERMTTQDRLHALPLRTAHPLTPMLFGLADVRGLSALPLARYVEYMSRIPSANTMLTAQTAEVPAAVLLELAAARYVATLGAGSRTAAADPEMMLIARGKEIALYENRAALPRARIVQRSRAAADLDEALALLEQLTSDAIHVGSTPMTHTVILEPGDWTPAPSRESAEPAAREAGEATVTDASDPDVLVVEVEGARGGFLVLADSYYPGWEARVDGQRVDIHPANVAFRAVSLDSESHRVEFRYRPLSFSIGVAAFGVGIVVCAWLLRPLGRKAQDLRPRSPLGEPRTDES
ncbi:MAG: YfhO family protein, partial [Myxococcota bacterium]